VKKLVEDLNQMCDEQPFATSWHLKNLRTGETAHRAGDVVVPSASTRKIAILMTALKGVNDGKFSLDQPVEIQAKYQNNNSGTFQHLTPGFTITLKDALVMMIIVSDNTCTGTVADMVGLDAVNALCQSLGMVGTTHRHGIPPGNLQRDHAVDATNTTTPSDVALLLETILAGTSDVDAAAKLGCTTELCQVGLDILSWQKLRARLPAMLPAGVKVAHKTGTGARNINDAGIIFNASGEPLFILTVYTDNLPETLPDGTPGHTAGSSIIQRLARRCWDALA
jgi:beta-lactamase class A